MTVRVLVAYATKMGSTREIAEFVADRLREDGLEAAALGAREVADLGPWDAVVLGSALYAAHWQRDANRFITRHLAALETRPVWLFASGPLDHRLAAADLPIAPNTARITGTILIRGHRTFGGRLDPAASPVDPQILATHPVGYYRDWGAIRSWTDAIARALAQDPPGG